MTKTKCPSVCTGECKRSSTGGLGFASILTLIFITLKLTGHIEWSWWWVLAPTWIPIAIVLLVLLVVCFIVLGAGMLEWIGRKAK